MKFGTRPSVKNTIVFFYEELYDADGLYDPWHAFFLRCPDGGCKCGNYSRWVSIKTDTRTQALATCSGEPRCLMEWRRRLSNIKGHSTLDDIFTKFWRTEKGSWQTSSLEAQNYKIHSSNNSNPTFAARHRVVRKQNLKSLASYYSPREVFSLARRRAVLMQLIILLLFHTRRIPGKNKSKRELQLIFIGYKYTENALVYFTPILV